MAIKYPYLAFLNRIPLSSLRNTNGRRLDTTTSAAGGRCGGTVAAVAVASMKSGGPPTTGDCEGGDREMLRWLCCGWPLLSLLERRTMSLGLEDEDEDERLKELRVQKSFRKTR